jgi:uncharacterized protein YndB with AHSA1/START domain
MESKAKIKLQVTINSDINSVWSKFNEGKHIVNWAFASEDWHCPFAESDLKVNGKMKITMAAKDGSFSFDIESVFYEVKAPNFVAYSMSDGRTVETSFEEKEGQILVTEIFEAESENPIEMQEQGWQAILNNFKKYCEA